TLEALRGGLAGRARADAWEERPDTVVALAAAGRPELQRRLRALLQATPAAPAPRAHVMRVRAQPFGDNAPELVTTTTTYDFSEATTTTATTTTRRSEHDAAEDEAPDVLHLDGEHAAIRAGSWLVMRAPPLAEPR